MTRERETNKPQDLKDGEDYFPKCGGSMNRIGAFDDRYVCLTDRSIPCSKRYKSKKTAAGTEYFCSAPSLVT